MNKHYRERFHVDAVTAAKDLQELGVNYTQEQLDQIKQAEYSGSVVKTKTQAFYNEPISVAELGRCPH